MGCDRDRSRGFRGGVFKEQARRRTSALLSGAVGLVLVGAVPAAISAQQLTTVAPALVFDGVTVVDVEQGQLRPAQRVVIAGNRIQAMGDGGAVRVPKGAHVVDARGKYLIPGLWDMHTHTVSVGSGFFVEEPGKVHERVYPYYIANGVTGIREMAQRFSNGADSFRVWQQQVMDGKRVGPRAAGPSADLTYNMYLDTPETVRRIVDSLKAAGDAFVKYHDTENGERDIFFALLREARRAGLPVVGHVPKSVTTIEAIDSGMRSIEHVKEHHECSPVPVDSVEAEVKCGPMAQAYLRNGTWSVPTLAVFYYYASSEDEVENDQMFVRLMHRLGVRKFLAGSDCEPYFLRNLNLSKVCHRGFALLQELIILGNSGLTPLEALQTATLNPAKYLNATDSLGTIAPGKLADLVLLDADPLTNIRNVLKIQAVVANGRYFDRATLDALDPRGVQLAKLYATGQPAIDEEPPSELKDD